MEASGSCVYPWLPTIPLGQQFQNLAKARVHPEWVNCTWGVILEFSILLKDTLACSSVPPQWSLGFEPATFWSLVHQLYPLRYRRPCCSRSTGANFHRKVLHFLSARWNNSTYSCLPKSWRRYDTLKPFPMVYWSWKSFQNSDIAFLKMPPSSTAFSSFPSESRPPWYFAQTTPEEVLEESDHDLYTLYLSLACSCNIFMKGGKSSRERQGIIKTGGLHPRDAFCVKSHNSTIL